MRVLALCALTGAIVAPACTQLDEPIGDGRSAESTAALKVCPAGDTVPGIDVSYWQGTIDWAQVATSDVTFAIARINDGYFIDPQFETNWEAIRAHGLVRGAYQFYEPTIGAAEQAQIVIDAVGLLGQGDLPVTLDVEWTSGTPHAADIQTWVELVTEGTGKAPMIYTALGYWDQYFVSEFGDIDLWVAHWGVSCPSLPSSWQQWAFWQWGTQATPGISGQVDRDVFNGSVEQLRAYANADASQQCSASAAAGCEASGCHCADGTCSGGAQCDGPGCSAVRADECTALGCGCADGTCSGGACRGTGCTEAQESACQATGDECWLGTCVPAGFQPGLHGQGQPGSDGSAADVGDGSRASCRASAPGSGPVERTAGGAVAATLALASLVHRRGRRSRRRLRAEG